MKESIERVGVFLGILKNTRGILGILKNTRGILGILKIRGVFLELRKHDEYFGKNRVNVFPSFPEQSNQISDELSDIQSSVLSKLGRESKEKEKKEQSFEAP